MIRILRPRKSGADFAEGIYKKERMNIMSETKKGGIAVQTEHIFPIIKKWLYSEKEIFLREIISNAVDAITKLRRLSSTGQADFRDEKYRVDVTLDKEAGTLTVSDNGIGMTEEETLRYLGNIALSGALEFIEKYEGAEDNSSGIIGHFGLGFYSAFMAADTVEVITKSYTDSPAVRWVCDESGEYEISECTRDTHGTDVIMHINEENKEYLEKYKVLEIVRKYCSFMTEEIYFSDGTEEEHEHEHKDGDECECEECKHEEKPINDTKPLWQKAPSECTEEEYKEFFHKVFPGKRDPLFHIHINADYPLNFKGILYFPKIENEFESIEGEVKLYYNSVFVADNIKEVIPEYMIMLCGVLDCPDLPLNVSRSYLQNNAYVSKVSAHISKKVADKLSSMKNTEREEYEKIWKDIKTFIEYGALRDHKFAEKVKDSVLLLGTDDKCLTLPEYLEKAKETNENTVYYTTDKTAQVQYISMFDKKGIPVVVLDTVIDSQYITMLEGENKDIKFLRVDADISAALSEKDLAAEDDEALKAAFEAAAGGADSVDVKFAALSDKEIPAMLGASEENRRFEDMMRLYGMNDLPSKSKLTLTVNTSSPLITALKAKLDSGDEKASALAKQIYRLALLSYRRLSGDEMNEFLSASYDILKLI